MQSTPEINEPNWRAAAERLEKFLGDESLFGAFVRLRIEIAGIFDKVYPKIDDKVFKKKFDPRNPILPLKAEHMNFDPPLVKELSDEVEAGLGRLGPVNEEIAKLLKYAESREDFFAKLTPDSVFDWNAKHLNDLAEEIGSPHYALISFGRIIATPFMVRAARLIEPNVKSPVDQSAACPICGAAPSYLRHGRNDGGWLLVCSLCETHWQTPAMHCPFCGCDDQEKLGAMMVADDEIRPIMSCDACGNYIKSIDERKYPENTMIIAFEEDTITLPYDMLAEREGYKRPHY